MKFLRNSFFSLCLVAACVPFLQKPRPAPIGDFFPEWPGEIGGKRLAPLPLEPKDASFAAGFPGRIGKFTDGERDYILRWVGSPTRKLHSSADCLRGAGFAITRQPVWREASGARWSCFLASRDGKRFQVRERISDPSGQEWTDVSAWYWSALLNRTAAPWFAMTIMEEEAKGGQGSGGF